MLMAVTMKGIGLMIKRKVKEFLCILTDQSMKENLSMICKKEKELKNGQMAVSSQDTFKMGKRKAMEYSSLLMVLFLKAVFVLVRSRVQERRLLLMNLPM